MKKLLIVLSLLISALPCFADNLLQQKAEKEFYNVYAQMPKEKLLSFMAIVLIQNDYLLYKYDADSDTMYADLVAAKNQYCSDLDNDSITYV